MKQLVIFLLLISRAGCSESEPQLEIIDGDVVQEGYEYVAQLAFREKTSCTASIVAPKLLISAAHCRPPRFHDSDFSVYVGSHYRERGKIHSIKKFHILEGYVYPGVENDLMLIELDKEISFTDFFNFPASVVTVSKTQADSSKIYQIAGYGYIKYPNIKPKGLLSSNVNLMSIEKCNEKYFEPGYIASYQICATNTNHPTARGDSGAPVTRAAKNGKIFQFGMHNRGFRTDQMPYIEFNLASKKAQDFLIKHGVISQEFPPENL